MKRACAFCLRSDAKISGEHAWPSWLREFLSAGSKTISFALFQKMAQTWRSGRNDLGIKVNDVCKPCNEGWMSALEVATKPILGPMVQGTPVSLGADEQTVIATWAQKTAMVFDLITRSGGSAFYSDEERNTFMRKGLVDANRTFVWLGQLAAAYEGSTIDYRMFLNVSTEQSSREAQAYCSTISVGRCVLQVLTLRGLDDVQKLRPPFSQAEWSRLTLPVWRVSAPTIQWPPAETLDEPGHSRFIDRWRSQ